MKLNNMSEEDKLTSEQEWDDAIRASGMRLKIQKKVGRMFNDAAISALEAAIRGNHDARIDAVKSGLVTGEGIDLPGCRGVVTVMGGSDEPSTDS